MAEIREAVEREMAGSLRLQLWVVEATLRKSMDELKSHLSGHFEFIRAQQAAGRLFAAGPLLSETGENVGNGLLIFRGSSSHEVWTYLEDDPFYANGIRDYVVRPWEVNVGSITLSVDIGASSGKIS